MAYFEAAYHYNKRHNALEDAPWIDLLVVREAAHVAACYVMNVKHLTTLRMCCPVFMREKTSNLTHIFFQLKPPTGIFVGCISKNDHPTIIEVENGNV